MPRQLSRRAVATTGIIAVLWWVAAIIWGLLDSHRVGSEWGWTSYTPIAASEANDLIGWVLWTGATVTIGAGVILLVSGNLPAEGGRLGILRAILPLSFVEASHLAGSVAGEHRVCVRRAG